jgi:hypothetical protein
MRKNQEKPRLSLLFLFPHAIRAIISVIVWGEQKYTPARERGWLKYEPDETLDSLLRHMEALSQNELLDPESKLHHANHMLFNAMVYVELINENCSSEDSSEQKLPEDSISY